MNVPEQIRCPDCGGCGSTTVTREMAIDAGDSSMEGFEQRCSRCKGDGWILEVETEGVTTKLPNLIGNDPHGDPPDVYLGSKTYRSTADAGLRQSDTPDSTGRTPKDYAIEFGGYLADAVLQYLKVRNSFDEKAASGNEDVADCDLLNDHRRALINTAGEFRKRATRAASSSISKEASPYDRDEVKRLEREIELTGDNRFVGHDLPATAPDWAMRVVGKIENISRPRCLPELWREKVAALIREAGSERELHEKLRNEIRVAKSRMIEIGTGSVLDCLSEASRLLGGEEK